MKVLLEVDEVENPGPVFSTRKSIINLEFVVSISEFDKFLVIEFSNGKTMKVSENYDTIKNRIINAKKYLYE